MASHAEIARFFRLALRVGVATQDDVERWVGSVLASEPVVGYPLTELASAGRLSRSSIDELLGEFPGDADRFLVGRMVMALVGRRLEDGRTTAGHAAKIGLAIGQVGDLPEGDYHRADRLDDAYHLADTKTYGDLDTVNRDVREFFASYAEYATELPGTLDPPRS